MRNIKSVKGLTIGDKFLYQGRYYVVKSFPTRTMVCGRSTQTPKSGPPCYIKVPVKKVISIQVSSWRLGDVSVWSSNMLKNIKYPEYGSNTITGSTVQELKNDIEEIDLMIHLIQDTKKTVCIQTQYGHGKEVKYWMEDNSKLVVALIFEKEEFLRQIKNKEKSK